jgi:alcohol dehydrogenase (cytochrome c)
MQNGEQYVSVVSGWGGAVPLWGGDVAKKVSFLEQGGMVWVFKLPKSGTQHADAAAATSVKTAKLEAAK